jgi:hypothetical protein
MGERDMLQANGSFPLGQLLQAAKPIVSIPLEKLGIYDVQSVGGLDWKSIAYYGYSIFWRATLEWSRNVHTIPLGEYRNQIASYLLGETDTPPEYTSLNVVVYQGQSLTLPSLMFPETARGNRGFTHDFRIPGMRFRLSVGQKFSKVPEFYESCIVRGQRIALLDDVVMMVHTFHRTQTEAEQANASRDRARKDRLQQRKERTRMD